MLEGLQFVSLQDYSHFKKWMIVFTTFQVYERYFFTFVQVCALLNPLTSASRVSYANLAQKLGFLIVLFNPFFLQNRLPLSKKALSLKDPISTKIYNLIIPVSFSLNKNTFLFNFIYFQDTLCTFCFTNSNKYRFQVI